VEEKSRCYSKGVVEDSAAANVPVCTRQEAPSTYESFSSVPYQPTADNAAATTAYAERSPDCFSVAEDCD
jgi:hypothetical protein